MRLQNSAQEGLCLWRQIVRALEPEDGRLCAPGPDVELLSTVTQRPVLPTGTDKELAFGASCVGGDPVALAAAWGAR